MNIYGFLVCVKGFISDDQFIYWGIFGSECFIAISFDGLSISLEMGESFFKNTSWVHVICGQEIMLLTDWFGVVV